MSTKHSARPRLAADGLLLLTALLWGTGFVVSQLALDAGLTEALLLTVRFSVAALLLCAVFHKKLRTITRVEFRHGMLLGVFLYSAQFLQILGQNRSTPAICAFLTTLNVLFVPLLSWAMTKKRPKARVFLLCALSFLGVGLLSFDPAAGFRLGLGELLCIACALLYACHISLTGVAAGKRCAPLSITIVQMATAAALSLLFSLLFDRGAFLSVSIQKAVLPAIYLGLVPTCLCFFLQTYAQTKTSSAAAAILLAMEGLFGSVFSVLLGMEPFTLNLLLGGLVILASAILMELLPAPHNRRLKHPKLPQP